MAGKEGVFQPPQKNSIRSVYDSAATEQGQNYDDIMGQYDDLIGRTKSGGGNTRLNYVPINSVFTKNIQGTPYQRSGELNTALTGLQDYASTGGYSDEDINNIRERSISPIRSIYDSANRNMQRQKVLSGGYSPNAGAVQSKMARESAGQIGDITTKVNANIAQMVASGKLNALNSLGSIAGRENEISNEYSRYNTDLQNQVEQMNAEEQRRVDIRNQEMQKWIEEFNNRSDQQDNATELSALGGKTNLYGTNPALTHEFGNQVLQNNQQNMNAMTTANQLKNQRANIGLNLVSTQLRSRG